MMMAGDGDDDADRDGDDDDDDDDDADDCDDDDDDDGDDDDDDDDYLSHGGGRRQGQVTAVARQPGACRQSPDQRADSADISFRNG